MKYFAKYIFMEPPIPEGMAPAPRLVKLFLCSRDIQVGDEIYLPEINEYHKYEDTRPDGRIICQSLNGQWNEEFHKQDRFKVIGEVSPEAIWAKEGDEFDEDQIKITTPFKHKPGLWQDIYREGKDRITGKIQPVRPYAPSFGISRWEILNPQIEDILIKLKCSQCNTFH